LPAVADRDRFAAAALAVDRLLKQLRRRAPSWQHYATSAAGLVSEAELGPN
jgi:hypothetical protein